jgi:hypothetical protein
MRTVFRVLSLLVVSAVSFAELSAWDVFTSGNTIMVRVGAGLSGRQCCRGASVDEPGGGAHCSQSCPTNPEITVQLPCNSVGTHVVWAYWSDDRTNGYVYESKTIDVTVPPAPTCPLYDFFGAGSRALTHKYSPFDAYPGGQSADAEVTLKLKARVAPGGTPIYLRVYDPADTAPYRAANAAADDNADTSSNAGTINGSTMSSVTLPQTGVVTATLRITDQFAGDNYEVRASPDSRLHTDPNFVCDQTTNCQRTPVITAWKRAYIENDVMFREGTYLSQDAAPCPGSPCHLYLNSTRGLRRGDVLRVIHAPRSGVIGPQQYYAEDVQILRIENRYDRVEVTPFSRAYFGPDTDGNGVLQPFLADAVGVVTGVPAADFYLTNNAFVHDLFNPAFVEYLSTTEDPVPFLPYEEELSGDGASQSDEVRAIARKWFFASGRPNHQHLLGGSQAVVAGRQGLTLARLGTNWSWVFVDTVAANSPRRGGNEWNFNGEVTAHEIGHQWQVNPPLNSTGGHCSRFRWNSTSLYCTMHGDYAGTVTSCGGTCPEFFDGQVGFHYQSDTDSEYMTIRHRPEPVPNI